MASCCACAAARHSGTHLLHQMFLHAFGHLESRDASEHGLRLFHCCLYCGFLCRFCHFLRTLRIYFFFCHIVLIIKNVITLSFGSCSQQYFRYFIVAAFSGIIQRRVLEIVRKVHVRPMLHKE